MHLEIKNYGKQRTSMYCTIQQMIFANIEGERKNEKNSKTKEAILHFTIVMFTLHPLPKNLNTTALLPSDSLKG